MIAKGRTYEVFADRTEKGDVIGARAAQLVVLVGGTSSATLPFALGESNFAQDHHHFGNIGRSDLCLLRCCDAEGKRPGLPEHELSEGSHARTSGRCRASDAIWSCENASTAAAM